jgi:RsmE family RNA methyltransferase
MNLLLFDAREIDTMGHVTLSDARATHLLAVLRVTPGQSVRLGVIDGPLGTGTVTSIGEHRVTMRCDLDAQAPSPPRVDVLLALPRPKVMRRLWAQLAALGVGRIILTNAERVERNYFDTHVLTEACYRPLLVEGLQQARDTRLPAVSIHRQFKVLVEDELEGLAGDGWRLVADPRSTAPLGTVARDHAGRRVLVAIGPEGGWNDFELALLEAHAFHPVGLGPRTLRVDTACAALLGIVHDAIRKG